MGPDLDVYRLYFRFLETDDEYFNYDPQEPPSEGRWRIYGLDLPDEVLEKIYYRNAERVFLQQNHEFQLIRTVQKRKLYFSPFIPSLGNSDRNKEKKMKRTFLGTILVIAS